MNKGRNMCKCIITCALCMPKNMLLIHALYKSILKPQYFTFYFESRGGVINKSLLSESQCNKH